MREELRKYADEAYANVEYIANEIGPRVPGTEGEHKLHSHMADKLKELGLNPVTEKFHFAPFSSIGGLPFAGWGGIIIAVLLLVAVAIASCGGFLAGAVFHFVALMFAVVLWTWLVASVFKYKTWFDSFFRQEVSHNTYAQLLPEDGEYDYTIYLSGHTDTSWTLRHSVSGGRLGFIGVYIKIGIGAISVAVLTVLSLALFVVSAICAYTSSSDLFANSVQAYSILMQIVCYGAPALIIGSLLLTLYRDRNPRVASPGAMDNATGIALAYEIVKYYKENPDKMPTRCRIIDANIGAEEAGLRGSIAFTRRHKEDGMLDNAYHINIDSVADKDFFEVIHGDAWLCPHFDKGLENMFFDAMHEAGIEKPGNISNPVGGCDSTPFMKAGVKSITFAAQNPIMSNYYHTLYDVPERFDADVVGLGMDVVLRVIDKIAEQESKN